MSLSALTLRVQGKRWDTTEVVRTWLRPGRTLSGDPTNRTRSPRSRPSLTFIHSTPDTSSPPRTVVPDVSSGRDLDCSSYLSMSDNLGRSEPFRQPRNIPLQQERVGHPDPTSGHGCPVSTGTPPSDPHGGRGDDTRPRQLPGEDVRVVRESRGHTHIGGGEVGEGEG